MRQILNNGDSKEVFYGKLNSMTDELYQRINAAYDIVFPPVEEAYGIVNDITRNFIVNIPRPYAPTDYEYRLSSSAPTWANINESHYRGVGVIAVPVGDVARGVGQVQVRKKNTSDIITNSTAFTERWVEYIDAEVDFGINGDGITDNAEAWLSLTDYCKGQGKPHYYITLPSGTIFSTWNKMLKNVKSYDIIGQTDGPLGRTGLQYKHLADPTTTSEGSQRPIFVDSPFKWLPLHDEAFYPKFGTSLKGTKILNGVENTSQLRIGDRIILFGYDQIGNGFPAGTRWNEWHVIESIIGNEVHLVDALKNDWFENWSDARSVGILEGEGWAGTGIGLGKPRLVRCDRDDTDGYIYPLVSNWSNVEFLKPKDGHVNAHATFQLLGNYVTAINCKNDGEFWPSMTQEIHIDGHECISSTGTTAAELDKQVDVLSMIRCNFDVHVSNGTSINHILIDDCTFNQGIATCGLKRKIIINSKVAGSLSEPPGEYPTEYVEIENIEFIGSGVRGADLGKPAFYTITQPLIGNDIIIPQDESDSFDPMHGFIRRTDIGTELRTITGTKKGVITAIKERSSDEAYVITISNTSGGQFVQGERLIWYPVKVLNDLGGHIINLTNWPEGLGITKRRQQVFRVMPYENNSEGIFNIYDNVQSISVLGSGYAYKDGSPYIAANGNNSGVPVVNNTFNGIWVQRLLARATGGVPIVITVTYA